MESAIIGTSNRGALHASNQQVGRGVTSSLPPNRTILPTALSPTAPTVFFCHTSPTVQAFGYLTTDRVATGGRKGHVVDVSFDQLRLAAPVHIHLHVYDGQGLGEKFSQKTKAERSLDVQANRWFSHIPMHSFVRDDLSDISTLTGIGNWKRDEGR